MKPQLLQLCAIGESEVTTRFWDIQILLNNEYSDSESKAVIVNSRTICHFVERTIYPLNHPCEFARLVIECSKSENKEEFRKFKDPKVSLHSREFFQLFVRKPHIKIFYAFDKLC
jgi:hypothetical protein